ncbi:MAG: DivIVA domain-containing protein [Nesterenkonia sp.]|nr:DivIVA domain-containing protein [Nesterenkonia sp.]
MEWLYVVAVVLVGLIVMVLVTGRGASAGTEDEIPGPPRPLPHRAASPEALRDVRFTRAPRGYSPEAVDDLLDEVVAAMRSSGSRAPGPPKGSAGELVRGARFPVTLGGYRMDEVDTVLAGLTAEPRRDDAGMTSPPSAG